MSLNLQCEQVVRAALGEPAGREAAELVYRCPHPERHKNSDAHPSLKINPKKDVWLCGPCGAKGKAWALAAFIAGLDSGDKNRVSAWLRERGLLESAKAKGKRDGRGRCVGSYVYTDTQGNPVARKLRFEPGENGKKKSFAWERREGGKWVSGLASVKTPLYRIAKIINSPFVVLPEGEKDAEAGANIGLPTATSGGTDSWREDHVALLRGKDIIVVADGDAPGRMHAQRVAASLHGKAASVKVCEIAGGGDLAEAIGKGMTREALLALFEQSPEWRSANAAEVLDSAMKFYRRFVSMTRDQARAVTLWTAHTHAIDAAECTPYLNPTSAEKQSGKTRLLETAETVVANPWLTGRTTAAALVRKIDGDRPTLLLDESDTAFQQEKEYVAALRGILNTGYRRSGKASLCVGQGAAIEVRDFHTFSCKAIAGISRLPDTVADRSIPIRLKRAKPGEVCKFREREAQREGAEIAARLAAWCAANLETLRQARPEIPAELSDRQADCCEPLLAIADLAGGQWPERARAALVTLCGQAQAEDDSIGVRLLRDIATTFEEKEVDELSSGGLCEALAKIETSPWGEWHGKPISPMRLAKLLKPFEVYPGQIHNGNARGYRLSHFQECFSLYLPLQGVKLSEPRENSGDDEVLKVSNKNPSDTLENAVSPNKDAAFRHLDTLRPGYGEQAKSEPDVAELRITFADDEVSL